MTTKQAKHFLLSVDEEIFIQWYNDEIIDPYGDFNYCTIRINDEEEIYDKMKSLFNIQTLVELCKNGQYLECDKYFMFTPDGFTTFDSIEELFDYNDYGEEIADLFLENEEENMDYISYLQKKQK